MSAESDRRTETVPEWKRDEVEDLTAFVGGFESLGVVEVTGIPSRQLQAMRADLHGSAELRVSRNTLVRRALEAVDEGVEALVEHVSGQVGIVGTDANPFRLYRQLEASKTPAPINPGEVAPADIVIAEGDTGIDPGPFVGELQSVGAAAQILEGSIKVTADSVVAEAGETVSEELASVLAELGIEPKEVGLDLRAVYADGVVFGPDELAIDVDAYRADVRSAAARGRALSLESGFPTARTAPGLIGRASAGAKALGVAAAVESPALAADLFGRADAQVRALAAMIDDEDALPADLRGEAPAEPAAEPPEESGTETDEPAEDEPAEAEPAADDDDGDDDDDAGGDALGAMFG